MATILFQAAGAALGSLFGPFGAVLGRATGALAGNMLDRALIGSTAAVQGSRLSTARVPGADEGVVIPRVYGTMRIGGTLIWATRFEEQTVSQRTGGKAGGSRVENFRYYANFAVGLCEGPVAAIRRVWADGRELDLTGVDMRFYQGTEDQLPDPLIEAKQGNGQAPAYRGLAYVVFERMPLDDFGNRIPLLQFEIIRPVGSLEAEIRSVVVIPGATEAGYSTGQVTQEDGQGSQAILNRHQLRSDTDWQASIDELQAICPNLESIALVVSWFGTDLRAGHCRIVPGVEQKVRDGENPAWQVAGIRREQAYAISDNSGGPAYGSTPSDLSVLQAIADLKARGLKVMLYPFLMMDIPGGNHLPDPHGGQEQAAYAWRGRLSCFPPDADGTASAREQVAAFCGTAARADFSIVDGMPVLNGSDEGYRRLVLHYAMLAASAGGVDGFIIGSEMRGLTCLRDEAGGFPFVSQLMALADDVRTILGERTGITYAADWSEYFGYRPADGSGDVYYNLDPLWAHPAINAVGIDNYMPLSDWRDDDVAAANPDGFRFAADRQVLARQINRGEGYDWFYASEEDRAARRRTPITDGLAGKPWVYRYKDLESWWSLPHYERRSGVEESTPTQWVPGSKPFWFTELGCPAVDKGANQPNVFTDAKSAESAVPYFSTGGRNDNVQRRFLDAHFDHWKGSGLVYTANIFLWAWDARPYPAFPSRADVWSDGENWRTGHWLNGRLGTATLADTLCAIMRDHGFEDFDVSGVSGDLGGYVQADVAAARDLMDPLLSVFRIVVTEHQGKLIFRSMNAQSLSSVPVSVVVEEEGSPLWQETRGHDSDYPCGAVLTFHDPHNDYEAASVRSRHVTAASSRLISDSLPAAMNREAALAATEDRLRAEHIARRSIRFSVPPQNVGLMAGDTVRLTHGPAGDFLISRIEEGAVRAIEATEVAPGGSAGVVSKALSPVLTPHAESGFAPLVHFLDLPYFDGGDAASSTCVAVFARPWRRVALSSSATTEAYRLRTVVERPSTVGRLVDALDMGVSGRFDRANALVVDAVYGEFSSSTSAAVLNGANRVAVLASNGVWEVMGFCEADEILPGRWRLSGLLRGLGGTEDAMTAGAAAGNAVVLLGDAAAFLHVPASESGISLNWMVEALGRRGGQAGPFVFAGGMRAQIPLSPVHIRARRDTGGQVVFDWIRRGRVDADSWSATDIPLDEDSIGFHVEILDGNHTVKRSVEVADTAFIYPLADEHADFGGVQDRIAVRIRQKGRVAGFGIAADVLVAVQ